MYGSHTVPAGETFSIANVPAGTAIGVSPASGGTMKVQYRITDDGPLRDWQPGTVNLDADDVLRFPVAQLVFGAETEEGLAEWYAPESGYGR